jgi:hypothetical protein
MADELDLTLRLLQRCFDAPRFSDRSFLDWVYNHNPVGPLFPHDVTDDGERICHIGGVPLDYRSGDRDGRFLLLLNSSVAPDTQRRGVYVHALQDLQKEQEVAGFDGSWGVTNAQSTAPGKKAGYRQVLTLPVKACAPLARSRHVVDYPVDEAFLTSPRFEALTADLDDFAVQGWVQRWTPDVLRWRLRFPGQRYVVHVSPSVFAVSTRTSYRGAPVAVVLKLLPRGRRDEPVRGGPVITAACRAHRAPICIYAGVNTHVTVRGVPLKREWLPAPLNVMFHSHHPGLIDTITFDILEFLDFDPY